MSKKKRQNKTTKISVADYIKAVKRADREIQLSQTAGWQRITSVHKSKKAYDRKNNNKNLLDE